MCLLMARVTRVTRQQNLPTACRGDTAVFSVIWSIVYSGAVLLEIVSHDDGEEDLGQVNEDDQSIDLSPG